MLFRSARQVGLYRAAVIRRLRESARPSFPPSRRDLTLVLPAQPSAPSPGQDDPENAQTVALPVAWTSQGQGSRSQPTGKRTASAVQRVAVCLHKKHAVVAVIVVVGDHPRVVTDDELGSVLWLEA